MNIKKRKLKLISKRKLKKIFKIGLLGLGVNASKTLEKLNKDTNIEITFCLPRIASNNNGWFDGGILFNCALETCRELSQSIIKLKNKNYYKKILTSQYQNFIRVNNLKKYGAQKVIENIL